MFFALMLYGHEAEECNMTTYSARAESMHILDKLLWCLMEMSFLFVQFAYGDGSLGWTSFAHRLEITLKMSYIGCFLFSFLSDI